MDLLPTPELQPMFHLAQEGIGKRELVEIASAEVLLVVQLAEREQGAARAQPALLAAIDALQALHQELDVADAAAVELHVHAATFLPARDRLPAMARYLVARVQRRLDRREIH